VWGHATEIDQLPGALLERIEHYFSTYKLVPDEPPKIEVTGRYGYGHAAAVIRASIEDYRESFTQPQL
jgi:inorganic pyrophosphatase